MLTGLFSNAIYKLFRCNFPGQKSMDTCPWRNFMGGGYPGLAVQGGIIPGKMSGWQKSKGQQGVILHGETIKGVIVRRQIFGGNFIGDSCPGVSCPVGNYSEVIIRGVKVRTVIVLRRTSWGHCPRGSCPGGNVRISKNHCICTIFTQ